MTRKRGRALVGRDRESALLDSFLSGAAVEGSLVAIVAEPGIGKSWLAQAFADKVAELGDQSTWAHCWEWGGAPPFWPWSQILTKLLSLPGAREGLSDAERRVLAELVPDLRRADDPAHPSRPVSSGKARFELFKAVAGVLRFASSRSRLVVVLDDLHAADEPSLRLLHFVSQALHELPILIVGTLRNASTRPTRAPEVDLLLDVVLAEFTELPLGALSSEDVGLLLESVAGAKPDEGLVTELYRVTAGNPLFVDRMIHSMVARGDISALSASDLDIPDSLRAAIRARLAPLDKDSRELLIASAVLGRPASAMELCTLLSMPAPRVLKAIRLACDAGFLDLARESEDRYTLRHAVVREVLLQDCDPSDKVALHATVAETLSLRLGEEGDATLIEVAYHYREAAVLGGELLDKAIAYTARAGHISMAQLAYEVAVTQFKRALSLLPPRADVRLEIMLGLADALVAVAKPKEAREVYSQVALRAREENLILPFSRAAYGFARTGEYGAQDEEKLALLQEALERTPKDNHAMRAQALAALAAELWSVPDAIDRRAKLSAEALSEARKSGDKAIVALALKARLNATMGPDGLQERQALGGELAEMARAIDDEEMVLEGHRWRLNALLAAGQLEEVPQAIEAYARVASGLVRPQLQYNVALRSCFLPMLRGDFALARTRIDEALAAGAAAGDVHAGAAWSSGRVALAFASGNFGEAKELLPELDEHSERLMNLAAYQAQPLAMRLVCGKEVEGAPALARFNSMCERELPQNFITLATVAIATHVCLRRNDTQLASKLLERYRPFAECIACVGAYMPYGSFARYLGALAAGLGKVEEALAFYETAHRVNSKIGAKPWVVWTERELAVLLRSQGPKQEARAAELLAHSSKLAKELGMGEEGGLGAVLSEVPQETVARSAVGLALSFVREHDFWTLRFGAEVHRIKHQRGFEYLVCLLARPRDEISALEIAGAQKINGDLGGALDETAVAAYRSRVEELRETIEGAKREGDHAAGERSENELEMLTRELARATGLGGRSRMQGSSAERARTSVTRALRRAIDAIRAVEPTLATSLDETIRTGTHCRYQPGPSAPNWVL